MDKHFRNIQQNHLYFTGDSTELFQAILSAAGEIGIDQALAYLEQYVIEKRLAWLGKNVDVLEKDR